jgi:hypothetical protein
MDSTMTMSATKVPMVVTIGAGIITVATWLMTLIGGQVTGVSWDEPYRVGKLANLLQHGWFVDNVSNGQPVDFNTYVYGPTYDIVSHAFATVLVTNDWSQAAVTADAYAARHLSLALLAAVGLFAVGWIAGLLMGSWRWSLVATALLGAIPLWTGHAMFNSSDLPVAVGYTIVTLGVLLIARHAINVTRVASGSTPRRLVVGWAPDLALGVVLSIGAILAVGSRPATWPAVAVSLALALGGAAAVSGRRCMTGATHAAASVASAVLITLVVLALTYPNAFANPMEALVGSIGQSAQFGGQDSVESSMTFVAALGYLPAWLKIQLPIGIMLLALVGAILTIAVLIRAIGTLVHSRSLSWRSVGLAALLAQLLVLPIGAAVARSNLYDAGRQFLFIVPALAVFAAIGVAALIALVSKAKRGHRVLQVGAWALVGISVLLPVVDQMRLFPYNYVYANETASPLNDRIPTDYWRTSMRELMPKVPSEGATACNFDPLILGLVPIDCAGAGQVAPYLDTRGIESIGLPVPSGKYLFLSSNRGRAAPPPESGCTIVDRVIRTLHGEEVVMAYVAICEAPCVVQEAASCSGKSLVGANLDGWNLRGSDFSRADFTNASLMLANFSDANLTGANLTGANVDQADFTNAILDGVTATGLLGNPKALPPGYRIEGGSLVQGSQ